MSNCEDNAIVFKQLLVQNKLIFMLYLEYTQKVVYTQNEYKY